MQIKVSPWRRRVDELMRMGQTVDRAVLNAASEASESWYPRAFELWTRHHFDYEQAKALAQDELRQRLRTDLDERPQAALGRMCGAERQG